MTKKQYCPLCGSTIAYEGMFAIECTGANIRLSEEGDGEWGSCPNYKAQKHDTDPAGLSDWGNRFRDMLRNLPWLGSIASLRARDDVAADWEMNEQYREISIHTSHSEEGQRIIVKEYNDRMTAQISAAAQQVAQNGLRQYRNSTNTGGYLMPVPYPIMPSSGYVPFKIALY
jgi:hypothetical protein